MIRIQALVDDAKCYQVIRDTRWPNGVTCPHCASEHTTKRGKDDTQPHRQRYACHSCGKQFDDLTNTVLAGHHQPLRVWVLCLYFMGLNLSNAQIAHELGLNDDDVQTMTSALRQGIVARAPEPRLEGVIEADEVYIVAGHKGHHAEVQKRGVRGDEDA